MIQRGVAEGAKLVPGGLQGSSRGYFVAPTVFGRVSRDMVIASAKIFGPVLVVITV